MQAVSIHPCPMPGQGVHRWMFGATHALHRAGVPAREVESILRPLMTRREQPREIANTVSKVYSMATMPIGASIAPRCAVVNAAKMGEIQQRYRSVTLRTWEELSDPCDDPEKILRWAFKPHEFVCIGGAQAYDFNTFPLEGAIKHASNRSFIVPNPFKSRWGRTQSGKRTHKSNEQVLEHRFLVIEFDLSGFDWTRGFTRDAKLDYQARLHYYLSREFPLALIVFSGNESAHGWYVTKRPHYLMSEALSIGADPALRVPSQFTRMPWGIHANGALQRVIYFYPSNSVHNK